MNNDSFIAAIETNPRSLNYGLPTILARRVPEVCERCYGKGEQNHTLYTVICGWCRGRGYRKSLVFSRV